MKILAIDPGPIESAFVIWDGSTILDKGKVPSERILPLLGIHERDCHIVCEMIACYGMAVGAEVFETCVWIGRFLEKVQGNMERIKRLECKMHLCHSARANDSNVRQALIDRLGAPGTKKDPGITYGVTKDIWAALAVAVTAYDKHSPAIPA
jgi:hypothetical protein